MDSYQAAQIVASVEPTIQDKPEYFRLHRYRFWQLLGALPTPAGQQVLEVGSNPGQFTRILVQAGYKVSGTDLFPEHRAELWHSLGVEMQRLNLDEPDDEQPLYPPESFDIVVMSEVIEHLRRSPLRALATLATMLRPGGVLVMTTPNELYLKSRLATLGRMLAWRSPEPFTEFSRRMTLRGDEQYYTHDRLYTLAELRWLVCKAGMGVERADYGNPWERVGIEPSRLRSHPLRVAAKVGLYSLTAALPATRSMLLVVGRKQAS